MTSVPLPVFVRRWTLGRTEQIMQRFHIVLVRPAGYAHSECFREVAEGLQWALGSLGHAAVVAENTLDPRATNIVLGAHLLPEAEALGLPANAVVYNLEQLGGAELPAWYPALASRVRVWDYSELNLPYWARVRQIAPIEVVPIGFAPILERIRPTAEQDIDVLFYGSVNERRKHILLALEAAGVRVRHAFGVYGAERDALIARSKVVLNVHFYESKVFELVRVSYLLANAKAVVTEPSPDLGRLAGGVAVFLYEQLVEGCLRFLANEEARRVLELRAQMLFREKDQAELLRPALQSLEAPLPPKQDFPRRLNLGSGKDWRADCLNIDVNTYWQPDAVLDVSQPLPEPVRVDTERFGTITLEPGCFDEILANDVLEHIPNLTAAMTAALRLLRPGGIFNIHVPYDLSCGAWQDPTHVRAFNERSWLYYTDWFWYMGWRDARFSIAKLDFVLSPLGESLKGKMEGEELVRTPRAVDSMRVHLRKQLLSEKEIDFAVTHIEHPESRKRQLTLGVKTPSKDREARELEATDR